VHVGSDSVGPASPDNAGKESQQVNFFLHGSTSRATADTQSLSHVAASIRELWIEVKIT
jgi:hypothetical protein